MNQTSRMKVAKIKDMLQYGEVGECIICHKLCLTKFYSFDILHLRPIVPRKYENCICSYLSFRYPDRKLAEPETESDGITVCESCLKKHFESGVSVTEKGREADALRIIPYNLNPSPKS